MKRASEVNIDELCRDLEVAYKRVRRTTRKPSPGEESLLGPEQGLLIEDVIKEIVGKRLQIEEYENYTRVHRYYQLPDGILLANMVCREMCRRDFHSQYSTKPYRMVENFERLIRGDQQELRIRHAAIEAWDRSYRAKYEEKSELDSAGRAKVLEDALANNPAVLMNYLSRNVWARAYLCCSVVCALLMPMFEARRLTFAARFNGVADMISRYDRDAGSLVRRIAEDEAYLRVRMIYGASTGPIHDDQNVSAREDSTHRISPLLPGPTLPGDGLSFATDSTLFYHAEDNALRPEVKVWYDASMQRRGQDAIREPAIIVKGPLVSPGSQEHIRQLASLPVDIFVGQIDVMGNHIIHWRAHAGNGKEEAIVIKTSEGKPILTVSLKIDRDPEIERELPLFRLFVNSRWPGWGFNPDRFIVSLDFPHLQFYAAITTIDVDALVDELVDISFMHYHTGPPGELKRTEVICSFIVGNWIEPNRTDLALRRALFDRFSAEGRHARRRIMQSPPYGAVSDDTIRQVGAAQFAGLHLLMQFALMTPEDFASLNPKRQHGWWDHVPVNSVLDILLGKNSKDGSDYDLLAFMGQVPELPRHVRFAEHAKD